MLARWRILALLSLLFAALWTVCSLPVAAKRTADSGVCQATEVGALPARRSELASELPDLPEALPPLPRVEIPEDSDTILATHDSSEHPAVVQPGSSSPRGPPVLV